MAGFERIRDTLHVLNGNTLTLEGVLGAFLDLRDDVEDKGVDLENLRIQDDVVLVKHLRACGRMFLNIAGSNQKAIEQADSRGRLSEQIRSLTETEKMLDRKCAQLEQEEETLRRQETEIVEKQRGLERQRKELSAKKTRLDELTKTAERLDRECEALQNLSLKDVEERCRELEANKTAMERQLAESNVRLAELQQQCSVCRARIEEQKKQEKEETAALSALTQAEEESREQLKSAKDRQAALREQTKAQNEEYSCLRGEQEKLSAEVRLWQNKVMQLKEDIKQTDPRKLKEEAERLKREKTEHDREVASAQSELEKAKSAVSIAAVRRDTIRRELETTELQLSQTNNDCNRLQGERDELEKTIKKKRLEILDAENYLNGKGKNDLAQASEQERWLRKEQEKLREDILTADKKNGRLKERNSELRGEYKKQEEMQTRLLQEEGEIIKDTKIVNEKLTEIERRKQECEASCEKQRAELSRKQKEFNEEKSRLDMLGLSQSDEIAQLTIRLKRFEEAKKELFGELQYVPKEKYISKKKEFEDSLETIKEELASFREKYQKLCELINGK